MYECNIHLVEFLFIGIFFFSFSSQKYCQDILLDFDKSLNSSYTYEDLSVKDTIYPLLTDDIVFKMVVMALICVARLLQKSNVIIFASFILKYYLYR